MQARGGGSRHSEFGGFLIVPRIFANCFLVIPDCGVRIKIFQCVQIKTTRKNVFYGRCVLCPVTVPCVLDCGLGVRNTKIPHGPLGAPPRRVHLSVMAAPETGTHLNTARSTTATMDGGTLRTERQRTRGPIRRGRQVPHARCAASSSARRHAWRSAMPSSELVKTSVYVCFGVTSSSFGWCAAPLWCT